MWGGELASDGLGDNRRGVCRASACGWPGVRGGHRCRAGEFIDSEQLTSRQNRDFFFFFFNLECDLTRSGL